MKITLLIVSSLIFTIAFMKAQSTVLEGNTRISDLTPTLELFDSGSGENRIEGILDENSDDIRLMSLIDDIRLISADDIHFQGDNLTFGHSLESRTEFTFHHNIGANGNHGLTIENVESSNNRWTFYTVDGNGKLNLFYNATLAGSFATDGVYTASDKKLKKNIAPLREVLPGILALTPSKYDYIKSTKTNKKSIGFIAQDVHKYFPELVSDDPGDDGKVVMQLNYAGFGVIAIKAIQEQQVLLESQQKRIESQDQIISTLQSQMDELITRLDTLEDKSDK